MSGTIQLDLTEALLKKARASGRLESAPLSDLLALEWQRRTAGVELNQGREGIRAQPGEPMSAEKMQAEVKAAWRERRARERGR